MTSKSRSCVTRWCLVLALAAVSVSLANSARIIGGGESAAFPSVGKVLGPNGGLGSATLIERRKAVTAAHILNGLLPRQVRFEIEGQVYQVSAFRVHPDFDMSSGENDLAVLLFEKEILDAAPSPLLRAPPVVGDLLTLVGHGYSDDLNGEVFGVKHVGVTTLDEVSTDGKWISWFYADGEANTSTLDGGGPAFVLIGGVYYIAGIHVKHEFRNGGTLEVSSDARVDTFADWLDDPVGDEARVLVYRMSERTQWIGQANNFYLTRRGYLVVDRTTREVIAVVTFRDPVTNQERFATEVWSLNANVSMDAISSRSTQIAHIALQTVNAPGRTAWYLFQGRVRDFFSFGPVAPVYTGDSFIVDEPAGNKLLARGTYAIRLDQRRTAFTAGFSAAVVADQLGSELNTGLSLTLTPYLTRPPGTPYSEYQVGEDSDFPMFEHEQLPVFAADRRNLSVRQSMEVLDPFTLRRTTWIERANGIGTLIRRRDLDWNWRVIVTSSDYTSLSPHTIETAIVVDEGINLPQVEAGAVAAEATIPFGMTSLVGVSHTCTTAGEVTVTIPIGATTVTFPFSCPNDFLATGTQVVRLSGAANLRYRRTGGVVVQEPIDYTSSLNVSVIDSALTAEPLDNPILWTSDSGTLHVIGYDGPVPFPPDDADALAGGGTGDGATGFTVTDSSTLSQIRVHAVRGMLRFTGGGTETAEWVWGYLVFDGAADRAALILGSTGLGILGGGPIALEVDYTDFLDFVSQSSLFDYHVMAAVNDIPGTATDRVVIVGLAPRDTPIRIFRGSMDFIDDTMTAQLAFSTRENFFLTQAAVGQLFNTVVADRLTDLTNRLGIRD